MKERKKSGQRGSITIEASISLTFFIFAMIGLLFVIRTSRVQAAVQYSLNMASMDISQYTYLYYASGLYDLEHDIKDSGGGAKKTLEDATDYLDNSAKGVESIFGSIKEGASDAAKDFGNGNVDLEDTYDKLNAQWTKLKEDGKDIVAQIDGLKDLAGQVKGDPVSFAYSLGALATGEAMDAAKGRLIGGLFGRAMCEKYIGNGGDADTWLKRMGVEKGLAGLNFSWSNVMGGNPPPSEEEGPKGQKMPWQDVDLVVTYEVSVFPGVFKDLKATFAQAASTRAWLGGDAMVKPDFSVQEKENETTPETPKESEEPQESETPTEQANLWGMDSLQKGAAMKALVSREYEGVGFVSGDTGIYGYGEANNTFYDCGAMDVYMSSYQTDAQKRSRIKDAAKDSAEKVLELSQVTTDDGKVHTLPSTGTSTVELLIVVPENVNGEERDAIQTLANEAARGLNDPPQTAGDRTVMVSIRVVTGGGLSPNQTSGEGSA